jgi:hypothetical protein
MQLYSQVRDSHRCLTMVYLVLCCLLQVARGKFGIHDFWNWPILRSFQWTFYFIIVDLNWDFWTPGWFRRSG